MKVKSLSEQTGQDVLVSRVGKRAAGHLLDGETWQQFPEVAGVPG